jgi:hypothetical protein
MACSTNGEKRNIYIGYWWESPKDRDHWEDQHVSGYTILKCILERWDLMVCIGLIWLRIGTSSCEHGNEPSGFIKYWEIFE